MRIAAAVSVNEEKDRLQAAGTSELHKATWLPRLDSLCNENTLFSCYQNSSNSLETSITNTTTCIIWS